MKEGKDGWPISARYKPPASQQQQQQQLSTVQYTSLMVQALAEPQAPIHPHLLSDNHQAAHLRLIRYQAKQGTSFKTHFIISFCLSCSALTVLLIDRKISCSRIFMATTFRSRKAVRHFTSSSDLVHLFLL